MRSSSDLGSIISPRTVICMGLGRLCGRFVMVLAFRVMSSPIWPSPRVTAWVSFPSV